MTLSLKSAAIAYRAADRFLCISRQLDDTLNLAGLRFQGCWSEGILHTNLGMQLQVFEDLRNRDIFLPYVD